jgi:hypothetical protein
MRNWLAMPFNSAVSISFMNPANCIHETPKRK